MLFRCVSEGAFQLKHDAKRRVYTLLTGVVVVFVLDYSVELGNWGGVKARYGVTWAVLGRPTVGAAVAAAY